MKTTRQYKTVSKALMMTACMIVLGLAGCEKEGSDKTGKTVERTTENTAPTISGQPDRPAQTMQGAEDSSTTLKPQSAGDYIDDTAITSQVKAALLNDPILSASRIEVTTTQGVVKLNGSVDSEQGISRARELASAQKGVKSVDTDLSVSATAPGK